MNQHEDTMMVAKDDQEELIRDNERNFIEGPSASVYGPLKYMSKEVVD